MPGTYVFRPVEANLAHNTDLIGRMNPYCSFIVGHDKVNSQICKKGGKHPHWDDAVTIPMSTKPTKMLVEVMDRDKITKDDVIGTFVMDLHEIQSKGRISKWYPLSYKDRAAGEILIEASFTPVGSSKHTGLIEEEVVKHTIAPIDIIETREEVITTATPIIEEKVVIDQVPDNKVFIEQRQVIEPHTFLKEVDVVETRPVVQQIEVMEPVKVIKEVEYTEAVPVTKQIEVIEPQVVVKEIEVIEPRLVTKEIQVIENVPVKKQIEVIESKTVIQEIETFEPQTFTKQIEVIEHVPVMKQVEVTEPVHIKKAVEFVEPVITTKTITKELIQPVIIDEKITTEVGPATVVGVETSVYSTSEKIVTEKKIMEENVKL